MISELVHTDLPEPVVPAISIWGSLAMLPTTFLPEMSLPTAKATLETWVRNSRESMTSRMGTGVTSWLGTSTPTTLLRPVMGAIRTLGAPRDRAMSPARLVSLLSLTPRISSSSYRVTEGPRVTLMIRASMPKDWMVSSSSSRVFWSSSAAAALETAPGFSSR